MKRPVAPCRHCKNRTPTCHADCKGYKEYEEKRAEYYEEKLKGTEKAEELVDYYESKNRRLRPISGKKHLIRIK